uniref:ATP synthase F0 subunit 8 n=1 Tax=Aspidytes niobe TaxID=183865 RepID=UPI0001982843|nr:ATP synthase F0 subunit 8 [Aspidytes niobe]
MPQMAPMNWLTLYFFFTLIFLMFNFLNYYMFIVSNSKFNMNKKISKKLMNWKW